MPSFKLGFVQGVWRCHKWDAVTSMGYLQRSRFVACMTVVLPVKKYVNTRSWRLLCKHAYLNNTKTVNLIKKMLLKNEHIGPFMADMWGVFSCWPKQPPVIATEGTAPVTHHTHTHTSSNACTHTQMRMHHFWPWLCLQCIRSDNQVFSQRVFFYALRAL